MAPKSTLLWLAAVTCTLLWNARPCQCYGHDIRVSRPLRASPSSRYHPHRRAVTPRFAREFKEEEWDQPSGFDTPEPRRPRRRFPPMTYGEESRQYRRTVYDHDDWRKSRTEDRYIYYLTQFRTSGIYRNLNRELFVTFLISTSLCLWNTVLAGTYQDFHCVSHPGLLSNIPWVPVLGIPIVPFTLSSPSLALLLVFRTNSCYKRWDEARKNWERQINHSRDLMRMVNTYYDRNGVTDQQRIKDLQDVAYSTWAFSRAMKRHLSPAEDDEDTFQLELFTRLPNRNHAGKIVSAQHRPNRALQDLSYAVDNIPMHFTRKNEIQQSMTVFEDSLGSSERLLSSPVPLFYVRHTARFISIFQFLLPFAMWETFAKHWNHITMIPATLLLGVFLFGIDELASQLEEPFTILPMQAFCDIIYQDCMEIVSWAPEDLESRRKRIRAARPEHKYFVKKEPQQATTENDDENEINQRILG